MVMSTVLMGCIPSLNKSVNTDITNLKNDIVSDTATIKDTNYNIEMDKTKIGKAAREGEKCSGNTGYTCAPDLFCKRDYTTEDKEGICINTIVDKDVECPKSDKMVCGEWNGYKMGYASKCEAERRGATNITEGFCKKDVTIANDCSKTVVPFGKCEDVASGVQYNAATNTCESVEYYACMVDSPFQTAIECEAKCVVK